MADDYTVQINLLTVLKNLDRTLRGLDQISDRLRNLGKTRTGRGADPSAVVDRTALATRKLEIANQKLAASQRQADAATLRAETGYRRATASAERFEAAQIGVGRSAASLNQNLGKIGGSLRNLGLGLTSLGASLSVGLTAPLAAIGVLSVRSAVSLDSLKRGLTAITGSAEEANRQLARLTEIAKLPGIGFQEAIEGSIRLQAVGFSAEVAERALIQFSNAVALTGGGREELARITVQLGQMAAKGKILAQDLKPIIEAGPAVGRALLQAFGTVNSEDLEKLGLGSREFITQLLTALEDLPRAAAGAKNTFDNFTDAVFRASSAVGEAIIPVLTRLIETFEPIITSLAQGFKALPGPIQTIVILMGALAAAAGPAFFILGQFSTGIGGLLSAFGRLNAIGLLPTIANFRLLGQVMVGTASLAQGAAATATAASVGWVALGAGILGVVGLAAGLLAAFGAMKSAQADATEVDIKAAAARAKRIPQLEEEVKSLEGLAKKANLTADEQARLEKAYQSLEGPAKGRVALIEEEAEKLQALIAARKEALRLDVIAQQAVAVAAVNNVIAALDEQRAAQERLNEASAEYSDAANIAQRETGGQIDGSLLLAKTQEVQERASLKAAAALDDLAKAGGKVQSTVSVMEQLAEAGGSTTDVLLTLAQAGGKSAGDLKRVEGAIASTGREMEKAADKIDLATAAFKRLRTETAAAADAVEKGARERAARIQNAISLAIEKAGPGATGEQVLKEFRERVAANFDGLADDITEEKRVNRFREAIDTFLDLKPKKGGGTTSIENALEAVQQALADVTAAGAEKRRAVEREEFDRLLAENEGAYRLQLKSYREYLNNRAGLTIQKIDIEIAAERERITKLEAEEKRLRALSLRKGAAGPRSGAAAEKTQAERIEAETRIFELQAEQKALAAEVAQLLRESAREQQEEINKLVIEYEGLSGATETALNAATAEKYREALEKIALAEEDLRRRAELAADTNDARLAKEVAAASERNKAQRAAILGIVDTERALNAVTAQEEVITRAREAQSVLERRIAFDVEFRGEREEEAIRRRLEGEESLRRQLLESKRVVEESMRSLVGQGLTPPPAMIDFLREVGVAVKGLGELPFSEQFRLAEKEFQRIDNERLDRIADIERAVRQRTIAEVEGQIIIRRINGEYVGQLESQLALLKQIASASNDEALKRQAQSAGETVKDAATGVTDLNDAIRSTSIDALRDGFSDFFTDITDRTKSAKETLLNFVDSVAARINRVIADRLGDQLIESLFGTGKAGPGGGILARIKGLFGLGGTASGGLGGAVAATAAGATEAASVGAAGASAAASLTAGAGVLVTSITTAAAAFAAAVTAAGAAFVAAVAVGSGAQAVGGLGSAFSGLGFAGGGHVRGPGTETSDSILARLSKNEFVVRAAAVKRVGLRFLEHVNSLPAFADGGVASSQALLDSIAQRPSLGRLPASVLESAGSSGGRLDLKQVLVDSRSRLRDELNSAEGRKVLVDVLGEEGHTIRRRWGIN